MILMALQTWGIFEIIPSSYLISKNTKKGFAGAFITGILGGIFSSPCSTPVLIALLAIVAGKGSNSLGYTAIAAVFRRARHTRHCRRNIGRLCAEAFFQ
jgi:thiol:disulfide interchange protein